MLQILRDASKSWAAKTLMILLIVSFGIWGIGDMFRGNPLQRTVAKVGKMTISVQALEIEFEKALPEARSVFGPDLSAPKARMLGVMDRTLALMIENASFDQEVKRLGINVGDEVILDRIAAQPELRDKDGKFNTQLWKQALAKGGFSERSFIDSERRSNGRRLLFETVANSVPPPKIMLDHLYMARGAKRMLEVLTLENASIADIPAPVDQELQDYYQSHNEMFMKPEYRAVSIVRLATEELTKDVSVSDEELKKAYEERANDLAVPEQRDFFQVVLQDEAKAKAVAEAAKKSNDLAAAAKSLGHNIIELKKIDEKSTLPELYTTFFAMEENQISDAVKSGLGWHVVQLKKIYPPGQPTFDEAKEKLREVMKNELAADVLAHTVNQLDDLLAGGNSLEDVADTLKMRFIKIPELDAHGKLPNGQVPPEFPELIDVVNAAFSQNTGENSSVIDDKKGNYYVVRVDSINQAHVEPFDDVKDKVITAWKKEKQAVRAKAEAEDIAKAIRDGKAYTSFASRKGVAVRLSKPISLLGEIDKDIPPQALPSILKMKKDDVITIPADTHQYVIKLADIVPVDPARPDNAYGKVVAEVSDKFMYEQIEEYSQFLRNRFPVKIYQDVLESRKAQGSL